jgi:uncharacterized protein (DUF924 family)
MKCLLIYKYLICQYWFIQIILVCRLGRRLYREQKQSTILHAVASISSRNGIFPNSALKIKQKISKYLYLSFMSEMALRSQKVKVEVIMGTNY